MKLREGVKSILRTKVEAWHYVPTAKNHAKDTSRKTADKLMESRWQNGPPFLQAPTDEWPQETNIPTLSPDDVELRRITVMCSQQRREGILDRLRRRYSDWSMVQRAVPWIILPLDRLNLHFWAESQDQACQRFDTGGDKCSARLIFLD